MCDFTLHWRSSGCLSSFFARAVLSPICFPAWFLAVPSAFVPSFCCKMPRSKLPIQQATFLLDIDFLLGVWRMWVWTGRGRGQYATRTSMSYSQARLRHGHRHRRRHRHTYRHRRTRIHRHTSNTTLGFRGCPTPRVLPTRDRKRYGLSACQTEDA